MGMATTLKVDFHTHTADDLKDYISFSAEQLIDRAARLGIDAVAITNHDIVTFNRELEEYAAERGVLLIPGVELTLSNKHVLVINPDFRRAPDSGSLEDLARIRSAANLIIAPHPFYPGFKCLGSKLAKHSEFFDAVEFSFFYNHLINRNKKAVRFAVANGKPLVGSSDSHNLWQVGTTYTLVEAEKNIPSIVAAVKDGRAEVSTVPLSLLTMMRVAVNFALGDRLKIHLRI
jgi:predicted metal-dependent phosphoesterase TrpH